MLHEGSVGMSWRISIAVASLVPAFALSAAPGTARAAEAFLCGPDTVVYVAAEDLERKKHSDPCIAKYFGLAVAAVEASADQANAAAPADVSQDLKILTPEISNSAPQRQAALAPPMPSPGTDYRNVRVLNALSENSMWFHHTR